ncbi:hypothetical protein EIP86_008146 [Pleurotus ostreatoroseus]|nr:hypothetical protein EIP86_008146 [Pleurotus ostreatoroseus]
MQLMRLLGGVGCMGWAIAWACRALWAGLPYLVCISILSVLAYLEPALVVFIATVAWHLSFVGLCVQGLLASARRSARLDAAELRARKRRVTTAERRHRYRVFRRACRASGRTERWKDVRRPSVRITVEGTQGGPTVLAVPAECDVQGVLGRLRMRGCLPFRLQSDYELAVKGQDGPLSTAGSLWQLGIRPGAVLELRLPCLGHLSPAKANELANSADELPPGAMLNVTGTTESEIDDILDYYDKSLKTEASPSAFTVFVRGAGARSLSLVVTANTTVEEIMGALRRRRWVPRIPCRLVYLSASRDVCGAALWDKDRLGGLGIGPDCQLYLRVRARGGAPEHMPVGHPLEGVSTVRGAQAEANYARSAAACASLEVPSLANVRQRESYQTSASFRRGADGTPYLQEVLQTADAVESGPSGSAGAFLVHAAQRRDADDRAGPSSGVRRAAALPADVVQGYSDESTNPRLRQRLDRIRMDPAAMQELKEGLEAFVQNVTEHISRQSRGDRNRLLGSWAQMIYFFDKTIDPDQYWDKAIVARFAERFLPFLVRVTPGSKQREYVKADTLKHWHSMFVHCIVKYTFDGDTRERAGMGLLIREGLFEQLENGVDSLIVEYNLDRHVDDRAFIGNHELRLMFVTALENSMQSRRGQRQRDIQTMCQSLCTFFMTTRPSTMAPQDNELRGQGKYPRVENVRFYKIRGTRMSYAMEIQWKHFKNHNVRSGKMQTFGLNPVTRNENMLFCAPTCFIAHLFLRGVFVHKVGRLVRQRGTWEELCNAQDAELKMDPAMLKAPLFVLGTQAGLKEGEACLSDSISEGIRRFAGDAGLRRVGTYAIRRETANTFHMEQGVDFATLCLGHKTKGSLLAYSGGTINLPVVEARLGEGTTRTLLQQVRPVRSASRPGLTRPQNNRERRDFVSLAVDAIVRNMREGVPEGREGVSERREGKKKDVLAPAEHTRLLAEDVEYEHYLQQQAAARSEFMACFVEGSSAATYTNNLNQLTKIVNSARANKEIRPEVTEADLDQREQAVRDTTLAVNKRKKAILRKARTAKTAVPIGRGRLEGTVEERAAAIEVANAPPKPLEVLAAEGEYRRAWVERRTDVRVRQRWRRRALWAMRSANVRVRGSTATWCSADEGTEAAERCMREDRVPAVPDGCAVGDAAWTRWYMTYKAYCALRATALAERDEDGESDYVQAMKGVGVFQKTHRFVRSKVREHGGAPKAAPEVAPAAPVVESAPADETDEREWWRVQVQTETDRATASLDPAVETPFAVTTEVGDKAKAWVYTDMPAGSAEPTHLNDVPNDALRERFLLYLISPVLKAREEAMTLQANKHGEYVCHKCKRLLHDRQRATKIFADKKSLRKHLQTWHTPWRDLQLRMVPDDYDVSGVLRCPGYYNGCSFEASSLDDMQSHAVSHACVERDAHCRLLAEHEMRGTHKSGANVEGRATRRHIARQTVRDDSDSDSAPDVKGKKRARDSSPSCASADESRSPGDARSSGDATAGGASDVVTLGVGMGDDGRPIFETLDFRALLSRKERILAELESRYPDEASAAECLAWARQVFHLAETRGGMLTAVDPYLEDLEELMAGLGLEERDPTPAERRELLQALEARRAQ